METRIITANNFLKDLSLKHSWLEYGHSLDSAYISFKISRLDGNSELIVLFTLGTKYVDYMSIISIGRGCDDNDEGIFLYSTEEFMLNPAIPEVIKRSVIFNLDLFRGLNEQV